MSSGAGSVGDTFADVPSRLFRLDVRRDLRPPRQDRVLAVETSTIRRDRDVVGGPAAGIAESALELLDRHRDELAGHPPRLPADASRAPAAFMPVSGRCLSPIKDQELIQVLNSVLRGVPDTTR